MPTKPYEPILYREFSIIEGKSAIDVSSPLLTELVNFSTNLLVRCSTSKSTNDKDIHLSTLALYRHMIELTDGIQVLFSASCADASIPLIRSSFESLLGITYILETNNTYEQRSLSWLVTYIHKRLNSYSRLQSNTTKGKEAMKLFQKDKITSIMKFPPDQDVKKAYDNLYSMLTKPHIIKIDKEYQKYKNPEWYSLFKGPRSLYDLAKHLNTGGQYEILYRHWSTVIHGQDFSSFVGTRLKDGATIKSIRDPKLISEYTTYASSFLLDATRLMIQKYRPGEDLKKWYQNEIQANFQKVSGIDNNNQ